MTEINCETARREGVGPVGCRSCDLHDICQLAGLIPGNAGRSRQSTGALRTVRVGEALYRAGDPAHMLYAVRQGMLKTAQLNAEGQEQILAVHVPGEVLGLEAFSTGTYASDAIALQPVVCCQLPLQGVAERCRRTDGFGEALVQLLSSAVAPKTNNARGPVRQRVTSFLVDLGSRLASRGLDGQQFELGLSREEIANLLDTRIETVSRNLQRLKREEQIAIRGKHVNLLSLRTTC